MSYVQEVCLFRSLFHSMNELIRLRTRSIEHPDDYQLATISYSSHLQHVGQKSSARLSGDSVRKENMCALLRMPGDRKR